MKKKKAHGHCKACLPFRREHVLGWPMKCMNKKCNCHKKPRRARILTRNWGRNRNVFWSTVLIERNKDILSPYDNNEFNLVYDTDGFNSPSESLAEARKFCKWKGLKIFKTDDEWRKKK